jgi:protein Mpv17
MRSKIHRTFEENPRFAGAVAGFCTFSAGDLMAQSVDKQLVKCNHDDKFDFLKAFKIGALGALMNGWWMTSWYRYLDRIFGASMKDTKGVLLKIIADQIVYAPMAIFVFFGYTSMITSSTTSEMFSEFHTKMNQGFISTYIMDWTLWPLANGINFRFIPMVYRTTYTSIVQFLWQSYLSHVASTTGIITNEKSDEEDEENHLEKRKKQ